MLKHCNELVRVVPFRTIYKKGGSTLFFEGGGACCSLFYVAYCAHGEVN